MASIPDSAKEPLEQLRDRLAKKAVKVWDLEDDDPWIAYQKYVLLKNLVDGTDPKSKLAYQICHYMEGNHLDMDGIEAVFPSGRVKHKAEQKKKNAERKKIEGDIKAVRDEEKQLFAQQRANKNNPDPSLQVHIEGARQVIKNYEADLVRLNTGGEYKSVYPFSKSKDAKRGAVDIADWEILQGFCTKKLKAKPKATESNVVKNVELFCNHLGFSQPERDALMILLLANEDAPFKQFLEALFSGKQRNAHTIVAKMIGVDRDVVSDMFRSTSPLIERGILIPVTEFDDDNNYGGDKDDDFELEDVLPDINAHLVRVLREPDMTIDSMLRQLVGEPATTHLDWKKDFAHLGKDGDELINLVKGALADGGKDGSRRGINILLYGIPGTGKTEAIKAAAKEAGLELYVPGEKNFGGEPSRRTRLVSLILASELLSDKPNAAILADEMDDLFPKESSLLSLFGMASEGSTDDSSSEKSMGSASKVFLNRLLERNKTMTFWAANKPEKFDAAFRRRLLFSMEFRVPPADVRVKFWNSVAEAHSFELNEKDVQGLASAYAVAPGLMSNAIRHAALSGGGVPAIQRNLGASANLLFGNPRAVEARSQVPKHYDSRFLSAAVEASDFDLPTLVDKIKASGHMDFSLLLHGPAGTGKTEYLAFFANMLDLDVMLCNAADLGSMYHSESERKIIAAFAEAEATRKFLIIDEADTFLRDRTSLSQNHEVRGVNTMLTCMEKHPMPFGCTTNLYENIDGAAKRRFTFNIRFETLRAAQKALAFQHFFGVDAPRDIDTTCPNLVPADFVKVNSQKRFIGVDDDVKKLMRLLSLAAKARVDGQNGKLYSGNDKGFGFGTGPT